MVRADVGKANDGGTTIITARTGNNSGLKTDSTGLWRRSGFSPFQLFFLHLVVGGYQWEIEAITGLMSFGGAGVAVGWAKS